MRRFVEFLLRHHRFVLVILALVTLGFGAVLPRAVIGTNLTELFFTRDAAFDKYLERTHEMTNDAGLIVGIADPAPLSATSLARLERGVAAIERIKEVRRVVSLLDAGKLVDDGEELLFVKYAEEAKKSPERATEFLEEIAAAPQWARTVLSEDLEHTALVIEALPDETRQAEEEVELVAAIKDALVEAGYDRDSLHMGGTASVTAEIFGQIYLNLTTIFPIVVVALFLVGYLMFRRLWPVLITLGVALIAVVWTSGFALLLDTRVNLFFSIVPVIVLVISFSDVIHLCSAYILELGSGKDKHEAIVATGADVGAACLFTSATTFVGFTSLAFVPSPVMRQFGLVLGFGVAVTLIIALTLVPVLFHLMRVPKLPSQAKRRGADLVGRLLAVSERVAVRRPRIVMLAVACVAVFSFVGLSRLSIDASLLERLASDNPVRKAARYLEENFAGTATLSIFVESTDERDLLDPDRFDLIAEFQRRILMLPRVNQAVSFVDMVRAAHEAMREPDDPSPLPTTRAQMGGYLMMFEMANDQDFERSLTSDKRTMQMILRLSGTSFRDTYALGEEMRAIGNELIGPGVNVEPGGLLFFLGRWLDELIDGQKTGLLFSIVTIAFMMMIGLRSVRVGLWSMIPNMIPLLFLGGLLGMFWETADSDSLIVAMIAIGIGVDDTIHFLMRYKLESARQANPSTAISETFHFAGRAIVVTSIILVVGFAPLALSDYFTLFLLGTLLPLTLIVALLANLFAVPALAQLGWVRYRDLREPPEDQLEVR